MISAVLKTENFRYGDYDVQDLLYKKTVGWQSAVAEGKLVVWMNGLDVPSCFSTFGAFFL